MALRFILGHSGTGKSEKIYGSLSETPATAVKNTILIVPEQSTLQVQVEFLDRLAGQSMMAVEILSFQRLAFRVSDHLGIAGKTLLDDYGQQMVLRRLIDLDAKAYPLLAKNCRRTGYVGELHELLTELERYEIDADSLKELGDKFRKEAKGGLLPEKLEEIAKLHEAYRSVLEDGFISMGTMLDLMKNKIKDIGFLKGAHIYIDGFYGFTPIQYGILRELLVAADQVTIAMTIDRHAYESKILPEAHLFWEVKETIHKVRMLAYEERVEEETPLLFFDEHPFRFKRPALAHLQKHFFQHPINKYEGKPSGIVICQSSGLKKELEFVMDTVWHLVRDQGLRFRDIGILCGSTQSYERMVAETFRKGDIPYHLDTKRPLREHPLARWMMDLLDLSSFGYRYETVFPLLKNPMNDYVEEGVDLLENYCLAYGLRGKKAWKSAFTRKLPWLKLDKKQPMHQQMLEELNELKDNMLSPVFEAEDRLKGNMKTADRLRVLVEIFEENDMENKVESMADEYAAEGRLDMERAYRQAYGMLMALFDQMHEMLGEEISSTKEFKEILEAGLDKKAIGVVPAGLDEVVVGDIHRTRIGEKRALFVLGVNEGVVPPVREKASFITDRDRALIQDYGMTMAPTADKQLFREPLGILMNLLRATERLYVSYTRTGSDNSTARPSYVVHMIRKMFPEVRVADVDREMEGKLVANRPEATFTRLLEGLRKYNNEEDFRQAYLWFMENGQYKGRLETGLEAVSAYAADEPVEENRATELYGSMPNYSVTRLETYAACPFRFFMDYGLSASERKIYQVDPMSVGSLFHSAIEIFTNKMMEEGNDWENMDRKQREAFIDAAIDHLVEEEDMDVYRSSARNRYLVERVKRMAKRAIWAVAYQIGKGDFRPKGAEIRFLKDGGRIKLNGVIDRLDTLEAEGRTYITVVDYKSGNKKADLTEIYYGLQMQLLIYLNAAQEMEATGRNGNVLPAGAFYFHIDDPIVEGVADGAESEIEQAILEKLKLEGFLLKDKEIVSRLDKELIDKSDILHVALKKNGDFVKNAKLLSEEEFEALQNHVMEKAVEISNDIMEGRIGALPFRMNSQTACDYCTYKAVCRFDSNKKGCLYKNLEKIELNEYFL